MGSLRSYCYVAPGNNFPLRHAEKKTWIFNLNIIKGTYTKEGTIVKIRRCCYPNDDA